MRVHHVNCAKFEPFGGRLVSPRSRGWGRAEIVAHCLLIETATDGLVLVDTGIGGFPVSDNRVVNAAVGLLLRPRIQECTSAADHVRRLGFDPSDVRHIVLTHLDLDHAGGLVDFPDAVVHVAAAELDAVRRPRAVRERGYIPRMWRHDPKWSPHAPGTDRWFDFAGISEFDGIAAPLFAVPRPGHTRGHTGIAIELDSPTGPHWRLHAGDSYFARSQLEGPKGTCPPLLNAFQHVAQADREDRRRSLSALRVLAENPRVDIVCSHDPADLNRHIRSPYEPEVLFREEP
ncbi:MBL fold metallo-hydrolase [Nocardia seriolae]|nr:MBL fold metallo-hydrolase [Nocardia seriolae]MTJ76287.1 MBL fold metallo-hydrolase [Nocardia seriolae]MTJ88853.1 MBL fold metallo-hydrolase [Nocardia seriolae]MTK32835.1 MBL fold metallo-hydrolase [Nocardia seriolae]MTK41241.1 MBL fold metallo-hydrolase [Nocardia seriolae]